MFNFIFAVTIILFFITSAASIFSFYSDDERYPFISRWMFFTSSFIFILLGITRAYFTGGSGYVELTSTIWGYFYVFSLILILVIIYLYFSKWSKQWKSFITVITPFITIILLISIPFVNSPRKVNIVLDSVLATHILPVHIFLAVIGELFFFLSFAGSMLYLIMERQLRKKLSMKLIYKLPNLETIEKFNRWSITRASFFLTVGIIVGMSLTFMNFNTLFLGTAKEMHIYFSWIIILGIFLVRRSRKLVSRKMNLINIILFIFIMFLFVFTNIYITKGFHGFK